MGNHPSTYFRRKPKKSNSKSNNNSLNSSKGDDLTSTPKKSEDSSSNKSNYYMPEDDGSETERLQEQHYVIRLLFDGNFYSPISNSLNSGCKVLDLGCGPGTWILDMGSSYRNSTFIGIDISPTFPNEIKPANTNFIQANILDGLPFEKDEFDFIYVGFLGTSFTETQWLELVLPEILRVTKPGGWIEFRDANPTAINSGPNNQKLHDAYIREVSLTEVNPLIYKKYKGWFLSNSRLSNVNEEIRCIPLGSWDENNIKLGKVYQENIYTFLKIMEHRLTKQLDVSSEEYDQLLMKFLQECDEYKMKISFHCIYAQKR